MNPSYIWMAISGVSMVGTLLTTWVALRIRADLLEMRQEVFTAIRLEFATREMVDLKHEAVAARLARLEAGR